MRRTLRTTLQSILGFALVVSAACVGEISGTDRSADGTGPDGKGPGAGTSSNSAAVCTEPGVGATPVRRLSKVEYDNTVAALLGDTSRPSEGFPPDAGSVSTIQIGPLHLRVFLDAAETLAATAVRDRLPVLLGCDPAKVSEAACARTFIERFGLRAYRHPLDLVEQGRLVSLYEATRTGSTFAHAIEIVLRAMLISPRFLYRLELVPEKTGAPFVKVGPYEMASRLSYFLWRSMPDDALFAAAAKGGLATAEQVGAQAQRMLTDPSDPKAIDPRARRAVADIFNRWLGLSAIDRVVKVPAAYPLFDAAMQASMRLETEAFVDEVMWKRDGRLTTLLTAPFTFVDARLAALYGIAAPPGPGLHLVALDPAKRAGILTQPSLLSIYAAGDQTHPVLRGKLVRERLLCTPLPDPPANVMPVVPEVKPGATTRERWAAHSKDPACSGCHRLMDPLGFGFEKYDGIGVFRTQDQGSPVNSKGEILSSEDLDGPFDGVPELANKLAKSKQVESCVASQWFALAFDRIDTADACSLAYVQKAFAESGGDLRELLLAIVRTDAFLNRRLGD